MGTLLVPAPPVASPAPVTAPAPPVAPPAPRVTPTTPIPMGVPATSDALRRLLGG
jgi:hypothetical protein